MFLFNIINFFVILLVTIFFISILLYVIISLKKDACFACSTKKSCNHKCAAFSKKKLFKAYKKSLKASLNEEV